MQRRYAIALLIGIGVGLFAIMSHAIAPDWLWSWNISDWQLPDWDGPTYLQNAQRINLLEQGYLLKACHLFVEQGLSYLIVPSAFICVYVKLRQISEKNEVMKDFMAALKVSFWCVLLFSGSLTLAVSIEVFRFPGSWELRLLDVWRAFVFFFSITFAFAVPTLSLLGFIILTVQGRLKDLCHRRTKPSEVPESSRTLGKREYS